MDKRRFLKAISALSFMVIGVAAVRADGPTLFHAQSWLVDDKSAQLEILTQPYAKAPTQFANRQEEIAYQIGEALFRTPIILGGQAAKARISCNSCHLSGGDNEYFLFPNISGAAGTADVSNSFFSSFRGNQNFDPVIIPDLRKKGKIPVQNEQKLRTFIRGLIVEEFNGNEPSDKTLDFLVIYLQKIAEDKQNHNPAIEDRSSNLSVHDPITIIEQSIDNIRYSINNDDRETAILLIAAIRHQMGLIYERYQHPRLKKTQNETRNLSQKLALTSTIIRDDRNNREQSLNSINDWNKIFQKLRIKLINKEKKSLYSAKELESSLNF